MIAHRGASGYRPEHTRAGYELAIDMGADYIEPDLVMTKDQVLIVRHENEMSQTTDVAEKFPERKTGKFIDGRRVEGWFSEDFTLAEIKMLRARERLPSRDHGFDNQYEVMTFKEVLELLTKRARQFKGKRTIGVYPEIKHPQYFSSLGMDIEQALVRTLWENGWGRPGAPVFIQSFDLPSLQKLSGMTKAPLIFLVDESDREFLTPHNLKTMSSFLYGIGASKRLIIPERPDGTLLPPTSLVHEAHAVGLSVHAYTFRSDPSFLNPSYKGNPTLEYGQFCELGVDGFFSDFPDHARESLDRCRVRARETPK
ncbi:MAG: glycerophosphodiester phosphodiesterase family protein [Bdellovibrionales bacterium]